MRRSERALRSFRSDPVPIVLANGRVNPVFTHRGPTRPLTQREEIITDVVAEAMDRGNANLEKHFLEEALLEYETAIAVMPHFPHAHWNRGQVLLMLGRYDEGFVEFDWRFKLYGDTLWHQGIPVWCGETLKRKRLLLWHEHGYGDTIMVMRYLPVLQAMGARVIMGVPEPLRPLIRRGFPNVEVLDQVPEDFGRFDYRCPVFNLIPVMQHLGIEIPAAPYLHAETMLHYPTIGIAWSGNRDNARDAHRSIDIGEFTASLEHDGYELLAIQQQELEAAPDYGIKTAVFTDFAHTADCLMAMEHIVTVDTAVAHLAGALGHPSLHILVPHVAYWPWYNPAWYGTAKIYRQPKPGDWAPVFAQVNANLRQREA